MPLTPEEKGELLELRRKKLIREQREQREQAEIAGRPNFLPDPLEAFPMLQTPKTRGEKVGDVGFELGGSVLAGLLAAGRKTPAGAGLVALGAGGGEGFRQIGQQIESLTGLDVPFVRGEDAPGSSLEAAKRIGAAGIEGAVGEVGGRGVLKTVGALGKRLKPALRPGAKEAIEAVKPLIPKAGRIRQPLSRLLGLGKQAPLLPAEATESIAIDTIEGIARTSILGRGSILRQQKFIDDVATKAINTIIDTKTGGAGPSAIGELMINSVDDGVKAFSATAEGFYGQVDDLTRAQFTAQTKKLPQTSIEQFLGKAPRTEKIRTIVDGVDIRPLKKVATDLLRKSKAGIAGKEEVGVLNQILAKTDTMSFGDAQRLRSDLLKVTRTGTELVKGRAQGSAKKLAGVLDKNMNLAAKDLSGDALKAWRSANDFWKNGKNTFNSRFIKGIVNAEPSVALEKLVKAGPEDILKAKKIVKDPALWKKIQGSYARRLLQGGVVDQTDQIVKGKTILGKLNLAEEKEIFKAIGGMDEFKKFARALDLNQAKQPGGGGLTVFIALAQASALANMLYKGETDATSFTIIFGPLALSKIMTNPAAVKLLTEGMKTPATVKEVTKLTARLTTLFAKNNIEARVTQGGEEAQSQDGSFLDNLQGAPGPEQQPQQEQPNLQPRLSEQLKRLGSSGVL